jgi:hypothetical protein
MGQRPDHIGHEGHDTPGDEFAQGRGWNAEDEEDPTMRNEPGLAGLEDDVSVANRAHDGDLIGADVNAISVEPDIDPASSRDASDDASDKTDAIREDIEGTRASMGSTIDAIQEKLSPQRLIDQAKDTVSGAVHDATVGRVENMASNITETAKDTGSGLMNTIRENPLPAALVGIGVGWLFLSARRRAAERDRWRSRDYQASSYGRSANGYPYDRYGQYGASQPSQQENGKMGQMAENVKENVKDAAGSVGDRAQDMTDTVKEHAGDMADQAQWQAQRARGWLAHTWDENPLVVAGAALAAGALVGLSIPETQVERQMMGEASGNVLQKAADTAQDVTQNVTEKAQQAMQEATPDASKQ